MEKIKKILIATTLPLWLSSCSLADMAYNSAPSLIVGELEDAFDLNEAQIIQLDSRLGPFFAWHREEELTRYRKLLEQAALAAADGIEATEFMTLRDDIGSAWERSLEKGIDSLGDLLASLTPEQIEQYQQYHRESSEEYQDYLEKTTQQREIYLLERRIGILEDWFGEFDFHLEKKISERLRQLPDNYEPWIEYRERRHQALVAAMKAGLTRQQLKYIMMDRSTDFARAFEPARSAYWQAYAVALEDINSWLSKQHRQHAVDRLKRYAQIVESIRDEG